MDDTAQNPQVQTQTPVQGVPVPPSTTQQQPVTPAVPPAVSPRPEQPPVQISDDQATVPDAVSDAANVAHEVTAEIPVQEAHPAVEVAPQLQDAGVEKGKDADREQLPEEQLVHVQEAITQADTQTAASGISLASTPDQVAAAKKTGRIRDSVKWLAAFILRQWKKMQATAEVKT